jgi:hypothetical protein
VKKRLAAIVFALVLAVPVVAVTVEMNPSWYQALSSWVASVLGSDDEGEPAREPIPVRDEDPALQDDRNDSDVHPGLDPDG